MHNAALAQALCGTCLPLLLLPLPPKQIPEEHYLAVAEILAYVYQLPKEQTQ
jgi:flagellar biosynthesis protein FlhB